MRTLTPSLLDTLGLPWPIAAEAALVGIAFLIAFIAPNLGSRAFHQVERVFLPLARKRGLAVFSVILIALAGRAALLPIVPVPVPGIHDEFSHLLLADTLASGRLSNPTHPMWKHFETFQVNQRPTYGSMYPPAQGAFLALGQVIGHPWFGALLSAALMCGAICWMLQGWLPPGWALLGGALAVIRLGLFSYWVNSYWGGAAAAIGGCLVLGALGRMRRKPQVQSAIWMAIGAAILANSRPWEGLPICLGAAAALLIGVARRGASAWRPFLRRAVLPMSIVFLLTGILTCYYFLRTTGKPFLSPYVVNRTHYAVVPVPNIIWLKPLPAPQYRYPQMRAFYVDWEGGPFQAAKTLRGFISVSVFKIKRTWFFFFAPALTIGLLTVHRTLRDRRVRPLLWIGLLFAAGLAAEPWYLVHYAAPGTGLLLALTLQGVRHLRVWKPGRKRAGLFLARAVPAICLIMVALRIVARPGPHENMVRPALWCCTDAGNLDRERLISKLEEIGEQHLVFVHYAPGHNIHDEWVYNAAAIDSARVVFAQELGPAEDRELMQYFKERQAWVVQPDVPGIPVSRKAN